MIEEMQVAHTLREAGYAKGKIYAQNEMSIIRIQGEGLNMTCLKDAVDKLEKQGVEVASYSVNMSSKYDDFIGATIECKLH